MSISCFSFIGGAEVSATSAHLTEVPEGYIGVYKIEDIYCVRNDLTANYILMNDIDLSEALSDGGSWNMGTGWQPIGETRTESKPFKGKFDGNNYSLISLRFCGNPEYVNNGLFGINEGVIKNLNLEDFDVTGSSKYFGLVCAKNSGEIENIVANGILNAYFDFGGGFCGTNSGVISDCHIVVESTISRSDDFCYGNICGENYAGAIISKCSSRGSNTVKSSGKYSSSSAKITSYTYAGGITGKNAGKIEYTFNNSSFTATATAYFSWSQSTSITGTRTYYDFSNSNSTIGGVAAVNTGSINNCYNTGKISIVGSYSYKSGAGYSALKPTTSIGGIAGTNTAGNIDCCYNYDMVEYSGSFASAAKGDITASGNASTTSYYLSSGTSSSGTPLTETMFALSACFQNLDFINIWFIDSTTGVKRPQLINNPESVHTHEYISNITVEPTHLTEGVETFTCECGDKYTKPVAKLEGHTYSSAVTAPTCEDKGYTTYTCECGESYVADYVDAKGHTAGDWVVNYPATATTNGLKTKYCIACGDVIETQVIAATGKVNSVSIDDIAMSYKSTAKITPNIVADAGIKYTVTYSSSNPSVAIVDENGNVSALKTGDVSIICTVTDQYGNKVVDTCNVNISYAWWQWIIVIVLFGWIWY